MTKTKAQLRAEAVERLKSMDEWCDEPYISYDFLKAMLADSWSADEEKTCSALIDLLTDDEPPEGDAVAIMRKVATCGECTGYTMRKEVGGIDWADALLILAGMIERDYVRRDSLTDDEAVNGKKPESLQDSREKLEADMNNLIHEIVHEARECCSVSFCWDDEIFKNLLDRQAAITTQECTDVYVSGCEACRRAQKREVVELHERIDELEAALKAERMNEQQLQFNALVAENTKLKDSANYLYMRNGELIAKNIELKAKLRKKGNE